MPSVSAGANQLFSRIDSNQNGVTKLELQKLDQDQDGKLSQTEAAELNPQELALVNKYLSDSSSPATVVFQLKTDSQAANQHGGSVGSVGQSGTDPTSSAYRNQQRTERRAQQDRQNGPQPLPVNGSYETRDAVNKLEMPGPVAFKRPPGQVKGVADGTGYYPADNALEGGFVDKQGKRLCTLQDFLDGKSDYVSIALDKNMYKDGSLEYGDSFRIPELEAKYGRQIVFKAVDTGGAFTDKGFSRVDVCTRSKEHSLEPTLNGRLTLVKTP